MRLRFSLLAAVFCFPLFLGLPRVAQATPVTTTETFLFTSICTGCSDSATGVLTLTNYTLGNALTANNFVSFVYSSTTVTTPIVITSATLTRIVGALGASGAYDFKIRDVGDFFLTQSNFDWCYGLSCGGVQGVHSGIDDGYGYTWTEVAPAPEPSAASLLGLGLAGVGLVRRRCRR